MRVLTTVRVVWPRPLQMTNASMKALRVKWLTLSSIMPTRSTKKKNEAHVAMVMPNWAITGADNDHHCRSMTRLRSARPMYAAGWVLRLAQSHANKAPKHSAVKDA